MGQSMLIIREERNGNLSYYSALAGLVFSFIVGLAFSNFYRGDNLIYFVMLVPFVLSLFQGAYSLFAEWRTLSLHFMAAIVFVVNFLHRVGYFFSEISYLALLACYLPDGFETTSMSLVSGVFNIAILCSGYLLAREVEYFHVHEGYWNRLRKPIVLNMFLDLMLVMIGPLFFIKLSEVRWQNAFKRRSSKRDPPQP